MINQCIPKENINGLAIYGTGDLGKRIYAQYKYKYLVKCFLESCPKRTMFKGLPVLDLNGFKTKYSAKRPLIVVASSAFKTEIVHLLRESGLTLGLDFITWQELPNDVIDYFEMRTRLTEEEALQTVAALRQGKSLAILYGNCQVAGLQRYLLHAPYFTEKYVLLHLPAVCSYNDMRIRYLHEKFWRYCELFISQRVSRDNRFSPSLATDELAARLPACANIIWIPNMFFRGYQPQVRKNARNCDIQLHKSGRFPFSDRYVDTFVEQGGTSSDVIKMIMQPDFLSKNVVLDLAEKSLEELSRREKYCDISLVDYIRANYRKRQLFYSENHPINEMLKELVGRILDNLGMPRSFVNENEIAREFTLKGQDAPLYPSVVQAFGLREYDTEFYPNRYLWPFKGNLAEYTEEYLRWCWRIDIN